MHPLVADLVTPFVGRVDALDHLGGALASTRHAGVAVVLLAGPAGIGKTRLVHEFLAARTTADRSTTMACLPPDQTLTSVEALSLVVPDLDGDEDEVDAAAVQRRLRVVADAIRRDAEAASPLVLVIEDLQWAHPVLLALIALLLRRHARAPLLVIGTYRDGPHAPAGVRALVVGFGHDPKVSHLALQPLDGDEVARLLALRLGRPADEEVARRVVARSEGNPRFVEELAGAVARGAPDEIPAAVTELLADMIDDLDVPVLRLLELAAVCGPRPEHAFLEAAAVLSEGELEELVDRALDAGLLLVDTSGSSYRFRHGLLHEVVLAGLRPAARRRLHARCAAVLADRPTLVGGGPLNEALELVRHLRLSGDAERAVRAALAAADLATQRRAYEQAYLLEKDAIELYLACSPEQRRGLDPGQLYRRAGHSADLAGHPADSVALLTHAVECSSADVLPMVRLELARARYVAGDQVGASEAALQAHDDLPDDAPLAMRALLTSMTAVRFADTAVRGTPLEATAEGLGLARAANDPDVLVSALCAHALQQGAALDLVGAQASLHEAEGLVGEVTDPRSALRPSLWRLVLLTQVGAVRAAADLGRDAIARAERLGVATSTGQQLRSSVADALLLVGEWSDAATTIERGLLAGDASLMGASLLLARAELAIGQGRFSNAESDLDLARERLGHDHPRWSYVAAELMWWRRNVVAAHHHAARAAAFAPASAGPGLDHHAAALYALVRSSLAARTHLGDAAARGVVDATLAAMSERARNPVAGAWYAMAVGEASMEPDEQATAWAAAREAWRSLDVLPARAYASWRLGQAQLRRHDSASAAEALVEAADLGARLSTVPLLVEVRATATRAGVVLPDVHAETTERFPHDQPTFGLTKREREVLALVTEGWSNKRIAVHLGVSPRTIGTHVSSVLGKLHVETRGEAGAVAHRLGLGAGYVI